MVALPGRRRPLRFSTLASELDDMDLQFHYFAQMRFQLSFLAFCAACSALGFGLWFYGKGGGLNPDGSEIAISRGELQGRATLKTTGAVLLATATGVFIVCFLPLPYATVGG